MSERLRDIGLTAAKGLVTLSLLVILARNIDIQKTLEFVQGTSIPVFLAAGCVMVLQLLLALLRWRLVMTHQRIRLPFQSLLRYFLLGLFFNQVLPSSVGGDAVRAYGLVREGYGIGSASVAVLLDRLLGMAGLVLLVIVALPLSMSHIADGAMRLALYVVVVSAVGIIGFILVLDRLTANFRKWRIVRGLTALSKDARGLLFSTDPGIRLILLSIGVHLISILAIAVLALAIEIDVHWTAFVVVVPIAILLMTVPVSIAGWGVREGVMVVGLGYAGVAAEQAVALSLLFGFLVLVVALPGGLVWMIAGRRPTEKCS
jgi:uncharacterized protein (TIRG00374 family)